jgi:hypothetical protein
LQKRLKTIEKVLKKSHTPNILGCRLQIDADPNPVPDPAYHYDADPDFYLMRIQVTKMMRIHADPDAQHC